MAACRGSLCIRWSLRIFCDNVLPFSRIRASAIRKNTSGLFYARQRRFYCAKPQTDEGEKSKDSSSPRTLLEVYQAEPNLLHGPRKHLKPLPDDYVEKEIEKSNKIRFRTPVPIKPHKAQWTPDSKRVGLVGVKLGMSALWMKNGTRKPVTLIEVVIIIKEA